MEDLLQFSIDIPAELRTQPRVDNAIVQGLEPQMRGGKVHDVGRDPDAPPRRDEHRRVAA